MLFVIGLAIAVSLYTVCCSPPPGMLVAEFDTGQVYDSDVAREIVFLSRDEKNFRDAAHLSVEHNWTDWIQRLALRQIAQQLASHETVGDDPVLGEQARRAARSWLLNTWAKTCYGRPFTVSSKAELAEELRGQETQIPNRLRLSHIFVRTQPGGQQDEQQDDQTVQRRLATWRAEIQAAGGRLGTFQEYARRYSDSQTARRGGSLGWMHQGWLPPAAESVLYQLPEGTISSPLKLRGGWHLFFVERNSPAHTMPLERKINARYRQHLAAATAACRAEALAAAQSRGAVGDEPGQDEAVIRVGEWRITSSLLSELYRQTGLSFEDVRRRYIEDEILYQTALSSDWPNRQQRQRLGDLQADVWLNAVVQQRVARQLAEPSPAALRALFETQARPLRTMRSLQLRVLKTGLPAGTDPLAFFDELTQLALGLQSGAHSWEQVATQLNGWGVQPTLEAWPMLETRELAGRLGPWVFDAIKDLGPGTVSRPIQDQADLYVIGVEAEAPARALAFEEARPRLRARLLQERRRAASAQIVEELLRAFHFRLTPYGRWKTGGQDGQYADG